MGAFGAIAQAFDKGTESLLNIRLYKDKLDEEERQNAINNKIKTLEIQKLENDLDPERLKIASDTLKVEKQKEDILLNTSRLKLKEAEN